MDLGQVCSLSVACSRVQGSLGLEVSAPGGRTLKQAGLHADNIL